MESRHGREEVVSFCFSEWSEKFFNRSPLTLKFEAEKLERESQSRERESASESEQVVVIFLRS